MFSLQSKVHPAMMINIKADALYTIVNTEFGAPLKMVIDNTSKPTKHSVRPSAAYSIVMISLFSYDIDPKRSTTDFVEIIWDIPHRVITIEPAYGSVLLIVGIPPDPAVVGV